MVSLLPFGRKQDVMYPLMDAATTSVATWGSQKGWKNHVSDEFYELFCNTAWPVYKKNTVVKTLVFVENYEGVLKYYNTLPVQRYVLFVDDLHWLNAKQKALKEKVFALDNLIIVSTYAYAAHLFYPNAHLKNWFWLPHSAALRFQQPINRTARWDKVLLTGAVHPFFYPLRLLASKLPNVDQVKHPGYDNPGQDSNFVKTMLNYAVGITSSSNLEAYGNRQGYMVAKYFEIPAAGQLLLANDALTETLKLQGLLPGKHFVVYSKQNMSQAIQFTLDSKNRKCMENIRKQGHEFVMQHHTVAVRAQQFKHMLLTT